MSFYSLMDQIFASCLQQANDDGEWYISPYWKYHIADGWSENYIKFTDALSDYNYSIDDCKDALQLQVKKRNAELGKEIQVSKWIYSILQSSMDSVMLQQETDYMKNVVDYMQLNDKLKEKQKVLNSKEKVSQIIPKGLSFKKGI